MKKVIAASVVAVLLVGSSAMAQIDVQYQTWSLALTDNISLSGGGPSDASTIQGIGALTTQDLTSGVATASQGIGGALFQTGNVSTDGSAIGLTQNLTVAAVGITAPFTVGPGQLQQVGAGGGALAESQGASVHGDQTLQKTGDTAADADALNLVAFAMNQDAANACNDAGEFAVILGGSFSELDGECDSLGSVVTTMDATVVQLQQSH